jgi:hypothetical protein
VEHISHFIADGKLEAVEIDEAGQRFVMIKLDLAHRLLCTGQPSSFPLREANAAMAAALGPLKPEPGINIAQHWAAQRDAMEPRSKNEIVAETLAMYERAMR